jgi:hypothetical protein
MSYHDVDFSTASIEEWTQSSVTKANPIMSSPEKETYEPAVMALPIACANLINKGRINYSERQHGNVVSQIIDKCQLNQSCNKPRHSLSCKSFRRS